LREREGPTPQAWEGEGPIRYTGAVSPYRFPPPHEGNSRKSVDKHGVTQAEAEQVFFNEPLLVAEDARHSAREARLHALGARMPGAVSTSPLPCAATTP